MPPQNSLLFIEDNKRDNIRSNTFHLELKDNDNKQNIDEENKSHSKRKNDLKLETP